nr:hypothetical protein EVB34_035 [Rhizobium phage RHph_TM26]
MPYTENYNTDYAVALEGMVADTSPALIVSRTVETNDLAFGEAVKMGSKEHCVNGDTTGAAEIYGISVRSQATKAEKPNVYPVGDTAAILLRGAIWVKVGEPVAVDGIVTVTVATGAYGDQAVAAGIVQIANAKWETAATTGGLARLRIK